MIATLYVEWNGIYYGLPDVDPWDHERDARLYEGPWPVVAHPPCARWCAMAPLNEAQHGYRVGDDGGCFEAALRAVRRWGGVLEHPAFSYAWPAFELPRPQRGYWRASLDDPGWVTEVSQAAYGHAARKRTWLYYVGEAGPPPLDWSDPVAETMVSDLNRTANGGGARNGRRRLYPRETNATPPAFRDQLLAIARAAEVAAASGHRETG